MEEYIELLKNRIAELQTSKSPLDRSCIAILMRLLGEAQREQT